MTGNEEEKSKGKGDSGNSGRKGRMGKGVKSKLIFQDKLQPERRELNNCDPVKNYLRRVIE